MKTHRAWLAAAVSTLLLVAGACGDDGDSDSATAGEGASATTAASSGAVLDIEASDFAFAPATLSAPAGEKVTVTIRNTGAAPHTFTSSAADVDEQVAAGDSARVTITMPASGTLDFVCTLHEAQGMKGSITAT